MAMAEAKDLKVVTYISAEKQAVVWIKKAHAGSIQWVDQCTEEQFYYYCLLKKLKPFWSTAKVMLLVVMLFEKPVACVGPKEACATLNVSWYAWPIAVIPYSVSACIYIVLYTILLCRMGLRSWALGAAYKFHGSRTIVAAIGLLGAVCGFFSPTIYVASFICRPLLFLGCTKSLRVTVREICRAIPSFIDVIITLFVCLFLFTAIGMVLFVDTPEGYLVFSSWRVAISQMWVLFTTNNSPNVFLPAYSSNRLYFFYFLAYLVFMIYVLGNVLLAKVYDAYKVMLKDDLQNFQEHQRTSIKNAFHHLAKGRSHITADTWGDFFVEFCDPAIGGVQVEDSNDTKYNQWRANLILSMFHGIDLDKVKGLSLEQFTTIMEVFLDRAVFIPKRRPPSTKSTATSDFHLGMIKFYTEGFTVGGVKIMYDQVIDFTIVPGTMVSLWESYVYTHPHAPPIIHTSSYWIIFVFSVFYTFSISFKISELGFERFWNRKTIQHRFDFFNVYGLIIMELLYMSILRNRAMEKFILLLSLARVLRLCRYIKPLQHLFLVLKRLLPTYVSICRLLMILFFVFTSIGQFAFGGLIYNTNPKLAGSGFAQSSYWTMNFNDCCSGLVSLFVMMIMNDWTTLSEGYAAATGTLWAVAFYIGFFVICNLIVLNILIALILECFEVLSQALEEEEKSGKTQANDDDVEALASGAGERSAVFMLRKVLCSDDHEVHKEAPSSDSETGELSGTKKRAGSGSQLYGTFGDSHASSTARGSKTLEDVDPEVGGLRLPDIPAFSKRPLKKAFTAEDMESAKKSFEGLDTSAMKEMDVAATKVQSRFRGMMSRRTAGAKSKEEGSLPGSPLSTAVDLSSDLPKRAAEAPI
jgi:hypothetical protein